MNLTEKNKKYIDSLSYSELLSRWRTSHPKNLWLQGETGDYWRDKLALLKGPSPRSRK